MSDCKWVSDKEIERIVGLAMLQQCAKEEGASAEKALDEAVSAIRSLVAVAGERAVEEERERVLGTQAAQLREFYMEFKQHLGPKIVEHLADAIQAERARHAREVEEIVLSGREVMDMTKEWHGGLCRCRKCQIRERFGAALAALDGKEE